MNRRRVLAAVLGAVIGWIGFVEVVAASNVAAGLSGSRGGVSVPTWLFLMTGGGVIGVSSMLSMLVTDRELLDEIHEWSIPLLDAPQLPKTAGWHWLTGAVGFAGLCAVLAVGLFGPSFGTANFAVLLVFVGGRAMLTIVAYAVVNPWPALDPWRRLATLFPTLGYSYPERLGSLPATAGLLVLIYLEVVLELTSNPPTLATLVVLYTIGTLAGATAFGSDRWFRYGDPVSVWFRLYSSVAPIQRTDDGRLTVRWPGARLSEGDVLEHRTDAAFVLALVFELTYSGFIVTPPGVDLVLALEDMGVPTRLTYLLLVVGGYGVFAVIYWLAAAKSRGLAQTYLRVEYLATRFAPPLLAIAAGYHFAHYASFGFSQSLPLVQTGIAAVTPPLFTAPLSLQVLVTPSWFGTVEIVSLLLGHLIAVWLAHATSFDIFAGRLQAIRSQYAFVGVMIGYTIISMWLLIQPSQPAPV
jgi:hypothetical protein